MSQTLNVRYFAGTRETVGREAEEVEVESSELQLDQFLEVLLNKHPELEPELEQVAVAVNLEVSTPEKTTVSPGDEVALLPPVGGG